MKTVSTFANNQVLIITDTAKTYKKEFFSYGTKIAEQHNNTTKLSAKYWNFSRTTVKYLCQFLGYKNQKAIQEAIDNELFSLVKFKTVSAQTLNK